MTRKLTTTAILVCCCTALWAQRVTLTADRLTISGDTMNWMLMTDGSQYEWVTEEYRWGNVYYDIDGTDGTKASQQVKTLRKVSRKGDDVVETYTFRNKGKKAARLTNIGIYTPFNDNYPDATICMTSRCYTHIWPGGEAAWVKAVRMNGKGPHMGLVVTRGAISDYEVWQRDQKKGSSNFRGVFALCPPDTTLQPGKEMVVEWRLFAFAPTGGANTQEATEEAFEQELLKRGGIIATSDQWVYGVGEAARVEFKTTMESDFVRHVVTEPGEQRLSHTFKDGRTAHADILGISSPEELIAKRVRFIVEHQQMNDKSDPRYGAFMVYDCEGDSILTNNSNRSDLDEGRERTGMGIALAAYAIALNQKLARASEKGAAPELVAEANATLQTLTSKLKEYANYYRTKLQKADYRTNSRVTWKGKNRGYNYAWVSDFYFRMYHLTGDKQYARDGYGTLRALFRQFGHDFYCIDYPVVKGLEALQKAGMTAERDTLLADFRKTGDGYVERGLNFPHFEVNYEQSIIAPAVQFLCELYLVTKEQRYLDGARLMMPALDAFSANQPSYHMNGIGIRHWDGFWFGKRRSWGDCYPHYWSTITAGAYHYYYKCTREENYQQRAENIVRNNLCQFFEDGKASCAFVYPRRVNGNEAHYYDAYANDQDFALMFYLLVNEDEK